MCPLICSVSLTSSSLCTSLSYSRHVQAGGNAKSTAGSIKENVGGLVSDQWAAEGEFTFSFTIRVRTDGQ